MFTGIIQEIGAVENRREMESGWTFRVRAPRTCRNTSPGDSLAVNGVCQTVETVDGERFEFTAVGETLRRTTMGSLNGSARVNLETAATPVTALGGHLVQGHVDGVGKVASFVQDGMDRMLTVRLPEEAMGLVVAKGSIAIDGISLTIVESKAGSLVTIAVVPFTVDNTIVADYERGTLVNVEADIIGKYVMKYLNSQDPTHARTDPRQEEM